MFKLVILFVHLLATCAALGAIIATELGHLRKLAQGTLHMEPPSRFVTNLISGALVVLYISGGLMIFLGLNERADYLQNPKLQGKLMLVLLLTLNAFVLHNITFRLLESGRQLVSWGVRERLTVAVPVGLSNSLWLFCAFLGIARPWSYSMPIMHVLGIAVLLVVGAIASVYGVLYIATRIESRGPTQMWFSTTIMAR